ncbi:hypothetical protein EHV15_31815 [Paenibacillus oralis]|uniref:Uncharacterized protein n=1 Tax=Paenibacillus oralis TaxID=2490856 RepID=A0A3P3U9H3_9BACL|nr:hypothetical protein [Paenibacillus oralis]RRJ67002.1 hypothetical protein EHV15_31815 [Paenibacillus oralis]
MRVSQVYQYDNNENLSNVSHKSNLLNNPDFETFDSNGNVANGWNMYIGQGINETYEMLAISAVEEKRAQQMTATGLPVEDGMNIWQNYYTQGGRYI